MNASITRTLEEALQSFERDARKAKQHGLDKVIAQPKPVAGYRQVVVAKPSRYQPSPSGPPQGGKRRRQWR
jgi:hypothetical protein